MPATTSWSRLRPTSEPCRRWPAPTRTWSPVEADRDGLRTDLLEARLAAGLRPRLCYVVANFQNPSGGTLALDRRRHLAALADRYGFVIVEDDPYGALRFRGTALPPVRSFTPLAVTLGTASKILAPGLRVGWLAAPAWLHGPLVRLKQAADLHTSTLCQRMALEVLSDEAFMADHLTGLGPFYGQRGDALADAIEAELGERASFDRPDGGMFLWVRLVDSPRPGSRAAARWPSTPASPSCPARPSSSTARAVTASASPSPR